MDEPYPEAAKMLEVKDQSQVIGLFIETSGYVLCKLPSPNSEHYIPTHKSIEQILADYFAIDLDKVEKERQQMLATIRSEP